MLKRSDVTLAFEDGVRMAAQGWQHFEDRRVVYLSWMGDDCTILIGVVQQGGCGAIPVSCIRFEGKYFITSTDIRRILAGIGSRTERISNMNYRRILDPHCVIRVTQRLAPKMFTLFRSFRNPEVMRGNTTVAILWGSLERLLKGVIHRALVA